MSKMGTAIITGASSGIGAAYADRLAAAGYDLTLVARRGERLTELAARLSRKFVVNAEPWTVDLSSPAELGGLERRLAEQPVAMLVNNAGAGGLGPVAATGADAQEQLIGLNITALVRLSLAALKGFEKAGSGTLVNIASVMAFAPTAGGATYSGSKAFVLNFTRSLAEEYAQGGIRIQAVLPGPIRTEFFSAQGMSDAIFPEAAYIGAGQLVDAALVGLAAGETVTVPTLVEAGDWETMETARMRFLSGVMGGRVAERYHTAGG